MDPNNPQPPQNSGGSQPVDGQQMPPQPPVAVPEVPQPVASPAPEVAQPPQQPVQPAAPQPQVGAPMQPQPPAAPIGQAAKTNIFAILSLVFAILFWPLGVLFGIIAMVQIGKKGEKGKGLAIAGLVLSAVVFLFSIMVILATFQGVQGLARDQEVEVDLSAIGAQLEVYRAENNGLYPSELRLSDFPGLDPEALVDSQGNSYLYQTAPAGCQDNCRSYRLSGQASDGGVIFYDSLF